MHENDRSPYHSEDPRATRNLALPGLRARFLAWLGMTPRTQSATAAGGKDTAATAGAGANFANRDGGR